MIFGGRMSMKKVAIDTLLIENELNGTVSSDVLFCLKS